MCYRIAEWNQRYEVSKKGAPATVGDELRAGPLAYIRSAVHGRQMSLGFRKLQKFSGKPNLYRNFGIFQKFLEIAGDIKIPLRNGTLYNEQDKPATIEDLCFMMDLPKSTLVPAIQALIKAGWMIDSGNSQNLPKIPGNSGTLQELNSIQYNTIQDKDRKNPSQKQYLDHIFLSDEEHAKLIERFGDKETAVWIEKLDSYIGSKGHKYKSHYKTIISWSLRDERNDNAKSKPQHTVPERDFSKQESQYGQTIDV
jgi:hypothetical protein